MLTVTPCCALPIRVYVDVDRVRWLGRDRVPTTPIPGSGVVTCAFCNGRIYLGALGTPA